VEEIVAKHVGYQVYLKERKVRLEEGDTVFYCYRKKAPGSVTPKKTSVLARSFRKGARTADYPVGIITTDSQEGILKEPAAKRWVIWWREGFTFGPPKEGFDYDDVFLGKATKYEFEE
jgi:hypothetical protein